MTISRADVRRAGITLAELAHLTGIAYSRLWRASAGSNSLTSDEFARVQRVLRAATARGELKPVA